MSDTESVVKFISSLGVAGVLIVLVYGLLKGWFVTGREHAQLLAMFTKLQTDVNDLRARDDRQQTEINTLRDRVSREEEQKLEAMQKLNQAQTTIDSLRNRIVELERMVGGSQPGPRT